MIATNFVWVQLRTQTKATNVKRITLNDRQAVGSVATCLGLGRLPVEGALGGFGAGGGLQSGERVKTAKNVFEP